MNKQAIAETQTKYVHMKTSDLLAAVKENFEAHMMEWEKGHCAWRKQQIAKMSEFQEKLKEAIDAAREGKNIEWPNQHNYQLREPMHHKKAYEKTIRRLEMTVDTEMHLTLKDFDRYVMDEWSWKGDFIATSAAYNNDR